jgi:hypothetical protein
MLFYEGDITKLKEKPIVIKEGANYRVEITFRVSNWVRNWTIEIASQGILFAHRFRNRSHMKVWVIGLFVSLASKTFDKETLCVVAEIIFFRFVCEGISTVTNYLSCTSKQCSNLLYAWEVGTSCHDVGANFLNLSQFFNPK